MPQNPNKELEQYLAQLPGVGPRQAKRMVYAILRREPYYSQRLGQLISNVRSNMKICQETFMYFYADEKNQTLSPIAKNTNRNHGRVLIIESDSDLENIDSTGLWQGTYFVLGGNLKPATTESRYEDFIRIKELQTVLGQKIQQNNLEEVVLGLSSTVNGDFTAQIIKDLLIEMSDQVIITELGRGLSTGTALEYIDKNTLDSALNHRT